MEDLTPNGVGAVRLIQETAGAANIAEFSFSPDVIFGDIITQLSGLTFFC